MQTNTWVDEMIKDIESKKKKEEEPATVKLSESDMNSLADIMIKKMSEPNFDVESKKDEPKPEDTATKNTSVDKDETPIE